MSGVIKAKKETTRENLLAVIWIALATFFFTLKSPLHPWIHSDSSIDSSVFQTVAMMMQKGSVPYKDTFDHKGPLLYLLNWAGLQINADWGIWLVEMVFLVLSFWVMYKTARLVSNARNAAIAVLFAGGLLFEYYDLGNMTEEYAILFTAVAVYVFVDYLKNNRAPGSRIMLCGMSLAAVLLLRPNMIAVWIVFCIQIFFAKLLEKDWKMLGKFVFWFVIGMLLVLAPTVIWLASKGALEDFWNAYIVFNREYTTACRFDEQWAALLFYVAKPEELAAILGLWYFSKQEEKVLNRTYLACVVLTLVLIAMPGRLYSHYGMTLVPVIPYPIALILSKTERPEREKERQLQTLLTCFACAIIIPYGIYVALGIPGYYAQRNNDNHDELTKTVVQIVEENTTEDDKISVYGNWDIIYVLSGRRHATRFSYQLPIGTVAPTLMNEYLQELREELPPLVVISEESQNDALEQLLDENDYQLIWQDSTEDGARIYKR